MWAPGTMRGVAAIGPYNLNAPHSDGDLKGHIGRRDVNNGWAVLCLEIVCNDFRVRATKAAETGPVATPDKWAKVVRRNNRKILRDVGAFKSYVDDGWPRGRSHNATD